MFSESQKAVIEKWKEIHPEVILELYPFIPGDDYVGMRNDIETIVMAFDEKKSMTSIHLDDLNALPEAEQEDILECILDRNFKKLKEESE